MHEGTNIGTVQKATFGSSVSQGLDRKLEKLWTKISLNKDNSKVYALLVLDEKMEKLHVKSDLIIKHSSLNCHFDSKRPAPLVKVLHNWLAIIRE